MDCTTSDIGPGPFGTVAFFVIVLATVAAIFAIRRRWSAREAAGAVYVAYWWEAIVHALAVSAMIVLGLAMALGFLLRNGF